MRESMDYDLSSNGLIEKITHDVLAYECRDDDLFIQTDHGQFWLSELQYVHSKEDEWLYTAEGMVLALRYSHVEGAPFLQRVLSFEFTEATVLLKIGQRFSAGPVCFLYHTFVNASAAVFIRSGGTGTCLGFANPFCVKEGNMLYFEPSLRFEAGELFTCDVNFVGIYPLCGEMIQPQNPLTEIISGQRCLPRYRNPDEGIALDFAEIENFNRFTAAYLELDQKEFHFMAYDFFGNLPQRPQRQCDIDAYHRHIDNVADLGADSIILNPLCSNRTPNESPDSYWELFPENSAAEELLRHARKRGLRVGVYVGTAGTGMSGNSTMIPFAENPQWKKVDIQGNLSSENCLGDDSFVEWYVGVQKNTIRKYGLDIWDWDPGPGNAMFCHNPNHRHLPGKGGYLGFRNSLKVMKALKDEFPNLYFQGFHGNKEYGLWGFRYIDQHEAYWENEVYTMTPIFPDLSVARATGDGIRFQSAWNWYFRFMGATLNHGLCNRMVQACWMDNVNLDKPFDLLGWKFALLSAIAAGGCVTMPILPHRLDQIKGYRAFYQRWIDFARKIFPYSRHTIPFGSQPGCGWDGFAKIKDNHGWIFLFNPFPAPVNAVFSLDGRIGIGMSEEMISLSMIYPYRKDLGTHCHKEPFSQMVPEHGAIVLEVNGQVHEDDDIPLPRMTRWLAPSGKDRRVFEFQLAEETRDILKEASSQIHPEAREIAKNVARQFGRPNQCWVNADRIWLLLDLKKEPSLPKFNAVLNGIELELIQDKYQFIGLDVGGCWFADVTDCVRFGSETNCLVCDFGDSVLRAACLVYPRNDLEALPEACGHYLPDEYTSPTLSEDVRICFAQLNDDNIMRPNSDNVLRVQVNLPPDQLEGVYASTPISIGTKGRILRHDMQMDCERGEWRCKFNPASRLSLIVDDEKLSIWAVTKDHHESHTYVLPFQWLLTNQIQS